VNRSNATNVEAKISPREKGSRKDRKWNIAHLNSINLVGYLLHSILHHLPPQPSVFHLSSLLNALVLDSFDHSTFQQLSEFFAIGLQTAAGGFLLRGAVSSTNIPPVAVQIGVSLLQTLCRAAGADSANMDCLLAAVDASWISMFFLEETNPLIITWVLKLLHVLAENQGFKDRFFFRGFADAKLTAEDEKKKIQLWLCTFRKFRPFGSN